MALIQTLVPVVRVPLTVQFERERPDGAVPLKAQVKGPVPPVGRKVADHAAPLAVHMVSGQGMTGAAMIVSAQPPAMETDTPAASVTVIPMEPEKVAVGVPDSLPVVVLKVKPPMVVFIAYV